MEGSPFSTLEAAVFSRNRADWAQLPMEILECLASRLSLTDYYSFGSVCTEFRLATLRKPPSQRGLPWLMMSNHPGKMTRDFFCLENGKFYQVPLPGVVRRSACCGSSHGWLIMSDNTQGNFLFNPFSGSRVSLPRIVGYYSVLNFNYRMYYIAKAVLSCEPTPDNIADGKCVVAAIFSSVQPPGALGLCRPGHIFWTWKRILNLGGCCKGEESFDDDDNVGQVNFNFNFHDDDYVDERIRSDFNNNDYNDDNNVVEYDDDEDDSDDGDEVEFYIPGADDFLDIIFYKGKFYGITKRASLCICGVNKTRMWWKPLTVEPFRVKQKECNLSNKLYLVESHGELFTLFRICRWYGRLRHKVRTKKFLVFKLDESSTPAKWVKVESIGDQVIIFVGKNLSQAMPVVDEFPDFKGNCIYFTDDDFDYFRKGWISQFRYENMGVFSFDDGKTKQFLPRDSHSRVPHTIWRPPIWITPNP